VTACRKTDRNAAGRGHALAEHVNDAVLADFVGEPGEELEERNVRFVRVIRDAELS